MTVEERVADFLVKNKGKAYCDDCLAGELGINHESIVHLSRRPHLLRMSGYTEPPRHRLGHPHVRPVARERGIPKG